MTTLFDEVSTQRTLEGLRMKNARLKQERRGMQCFLSLQEEQARLRDQRAVIDKSGQQLMQAMALAWAIFQEKEDQTAAPPDVLRHLLQDVSSIKAAMQGILARPGLAEMKPLSAHRASRSGEAVVASQIGSIGDVLKTASSPGKTEVGQNSLIFLDDVAYVPEPAALEEESADTFSWSSTSDPEAEYVPSKHVSAKTAGPRLRSVSSLSTVCSLIEQEVALAA